MNTFDRIAAILTRDMGVAAALITPAATLVSMGITDSLDQIEIAISVENEFGVDLEEPPFDTVATLGELVFAIDKFKALQARARAA